MLNECECRAQETPAKLSEIVEIVFSLNANEGVAALVLSALKGKWVSIHLLAFSRANTETHKLCVNGHV